MKTKEVKTMLGEVTYIKPYTLTQEERQKQIGTQISRRRKKMKMTQADLAEKTGYHLNSIHNIEQGKIDLPLSKLYVIAEALDVNISYLLSLRELPSAGKEVVVRYASTLETDNYEIRRMINRLPECFELAKAQILAAYEREQQTIGNLRKRKGANS